MSAKSVALWLGLLSAASPLAARAANDKQPLTVEEAVKMALQQNPRLLSSEARVGAGRDNARSSGTRLLPAVILNEEYQRYKDPFAISASAFGITVPAGTPDITLRKTNASTFTAGFDQPIVGLGHLGEDWMADWRRADASAFDNKVTRADLVEMVQEDYLQLFEAKALAEIARASEAELNDEVNVTQAKMNAGAATTADLLRVQVAAANAKQQEISATSQGLTVRARLLTRLGVLPNDDRYEFVEPTTLLANNDELPASSTASDIAIDKRPEVARDHALSLAAEHNRKGRWLSLLPEADLEGAYVRVDGQIFAPAESWFIGVKASWRVWEWGSSFFAARSAGKLALAARRDLVSQQQFVAAEAASAVEQSRSAQSAVDVAQKTIDSAQEAYRVTDVAVRAGAATTTDLLDAQSALTTARLNLTRARYELAMRRVELARAMGK